MCHHGWHYMKMYKCLFINWCSRLVWYVSWLICVCGCMRAFVCLCLIYIYIYIYIYNKMLGRFCMHIKCVCVHSCAHVCQRRCVYIYTHTCVLYICKLLGYLGVHTNVCVCICVSVACMHAYVTDLYVSAWYMNAWSYLLAQRGPEIWTMIAGWPVHRGSYLLPKDTTSHKLLAA